MGKEDWVSCKVPTRMAESIDRFLRRDVAKKNGIFSRTDFLTAVLRLWLSYYENDFDLFVKKDIMKTREADEPIREMESMEAMLKAPPKDFTILSILLALWNKHTELKSTSIRFYDKEISDFLRNKIKSQYEETLEPMIVKADERQRQQQKRDRADA